MEFVNSSVSVASPASVASPFASPFINTFNISVAQYNFYHSLINECDAEQIPEQIYILDTDDSDLLIDLRILQKNIIDNVYLFKKTETKMCQTLSEMKCSVEKEGITCSLCEETDEDNTYFKSLNCEPVCDKHICYSCITEYITKTKRNTCPYCFCDDFYKPFFTRGTIEKEINKWRKINIDCYENKLKHYALVKNILYNFKYFQIIKLIFIILN